MGGSVVLARWNEQRRVERAIAERGRRQMMRGAFAGADITRLTLSLSSSSRAINADLDGTLAILRARARSLCANYDYARRFLSLVAANIVGPDGPTLQVRAMMSNGTDLDESANSSIETHWSRWGQACDVRGLQTLPEMLNVAVKGVARDGEAIVREVRNRDLPYGLALQLLEADRLDETLNARLDNGNLIRQGVELDSSLRPLAYWILTQHPGENYNVLGSRKHERVLERDLHHLYVNERAEQVRGYTWMHAVLLRASHSQGFEEAAVVAARIGAAKVGFFKRSADASDDALNRMADAVDNRKLQMDAEPGEFNELPVGYDLANWDPDYPHEMYGDFVRSCLRGFSAGVDVDYASLSNDRASENYSSIRHGALEARDIWKSGQAWLHARLMLPIFRDWLNGGLLLGQITLLGPQGEKPLPPERFQKFSDAATFQGRRWDWVDPKNDAEAARLLIEAGLASRTEICAGQGRDFDDVVQELAREKTILEEAGLPSTFGITSSGGEPAGAAGTAPKSTGKDKKDKK